MIQSTHLLWYENHYFLIYNGALCHRAEIVSVCENENNVYRTGHHKPLTRTPYRFCERYWRLLFGDFTSVTCVILLLILRKPEQRFQLWGIRDMYNNIPDGIQAIIAVNTLNTKLYQSALVTICKNMLLQEKNMSIGNF